MKQKYHTYYCEFMDRNIGDGMVCFQCHHYKKSNDQEKRCEYEKVTGTFEREV